MPHYNPVQHPAIVFGAGGIGSGNSPDSFIYTWTTPESTSQLLDTLSSLNITILDSAHDYPPGNACDTNRLLGLTHATQRGFAIDSKVASYISTGAQPTAGSLTRDAIQRSVAKDLELLGIPKVRTMYVYTADPATPLSETVPAFDELLRAGKCEQIGLSNLSVALVREWMAICEREGFAKPKLYQGHYNAIYRHAEGTGGLLDVLRSHGVAFNAWSPLAGGFLSGKITRARDEAKKGGEEEEEEHATLKRTRFSQAAAMTYYRDCFDHAPVHVAMRRLESLCAERVRADPYMTPAGAALRWLVYHSPLSGAQGDGIIIGATREEQILSNMAAVTEGGPLPKEVADFIDGMWDGRSLADQGEEGEASLRDVVQKPSSFY